MSYGGLFPRKKDTSVTDTSVTDTSVTDTSVTDTSVKDKGVVMAVDRVWAIPVKKLDVSTLAGIFAPIQTGLNEACFLIRIVNDSNINLYISYDGATEHDYVESDDHIQLEFQAGAMPNNQRSLLPKGTIVYAKAAPGGTGYVYVSGYYVDRS